MDMVVLAKVVHDAGLAKMEGRDRNIFVHQMPEDVLRGVLFRQPDGGDEINWYMPGYYRTSFQVVVRESDYQAGMKLAEDISAALTVRNKMLGNYCVTHILPKNKPFVFPRSSGDLLEFSVHFDAVFSE